MTEMECESWWGVILFGVLGMLVGSVVFGYIEIETLHRLFGLPLDIPSGLGLGLLTTLALYGHSD